jgi:hypothetical protein
MELGHNGSVSVKANYFISLRSSRLWIVNQIQRQTPATLIIFHALKYQWATQLVAQASYLFRCEPVSGNNIAIKLL